MPIVPPPCLAAPAVRQLSDTEVLARLAFAEGISTACAAKQPEVIQAIAWGVMNRVRLGQATPQLARKYGDSVRAVVFKPGQFNPAVSKGSRFASYFRCPSQAPGWEPLWATAQEAAHTALTAPNRNPFLQTEWEIQHGISLVAHFYYPKSEQATPRPPSWVRNDAMVRQAMIKEQSFSNECVWFIRLEKPFQVKK